MSIQSPKSQRSKAPGESPAQDNNPEVVKGGTSPERHAGGSPPNPVVPKGLDHHGGKHQGNADQENSPMAGGGSAPPHQGGGPGFAKGKGDAERSGGTVHQT